MVLLSLLVRFPKLRAPTESWPIIPETERGAFSELSSDFAVLDREAAPAFTEYDKAALREQNRYRRQQVLIILGSALITGLGGLQAVFRGQRWPGLLLAVLGVALAASTRFANERASLAAYLGARAKAERLRALYFRYLSAMGRYAGGDRGSPCAATCWRSGTGRSRDERPGRTVPDLYRTLRIADQRKYYEDRRREYEQASGQAIVVRNTLLVLAALAGVAGQLTTGTGRALSGVTAAVLAALAGGVTAFEGLIGFAQLRKLYNDAALNLAEAEIDWDAAGPGGDLEAEVERVEQILRSENGQWGQLVIESTPKEAPTAGTEGQ